MSFVPDWPADVSRETQVARTWHAFGREKEAAVQAILDVDRPPSEAAFAIGETVRQYFCAHGLALTDTELRRLVSERLCRYRPASPLVAFAHLPNRPWTGGEIAQSDPVVAEGGFGEAPFGIVRFASGRPQSPAPVDSLWAD